MAQIRHSLLLLLLLLSLTITSASTTKPGFRIDLINRFSPRSPFNATKSGNLAQRLLQQSQTHFSHLKKTIFTGINTTAMRPPIFEQDKLYLAVIGIGTGNEAKMYYLDMDTGSGLTWIQCQPCSPCFPQTTGTFNPSTSPTYQHMPCNDPLCVRPYGCIFGVCKYMLSYADRSYITGDLSTETFNFPTSPSGGQFESIPDLAFGK